MDIQMLTPRQAARRGALFGLPFLLLLFVLSSYVELGEALAATVSGYCLLTAGLILSRLRHSAWFWLTLAALAAAHAFVIVRVPWQWTDRLTAPEIWPLGIADLLFDVGCLRLVAWLVGERTKE